MESVLSQEFWRLREMSSVEDLRKALAEVEAIVWATCESGSLGMEKMNELLHKFSVFHA